MFVLRDHGLVDGSVVVGGAYVRHPLVIFEGLQRVLHPVAERGIGGLLAFVAEDEHEAGQGRNLIVQYVVDPP